MATPQDLEDRAHVQHAYEDFDDSGSRRGNGWAIFAGSLMVLGGMFQFFQGLAAALGGNLFLVGTDYVYSINITTWGWVHLIIGAIVALAGFGIFSGALWARTI